MYITAGLLAIPKPFPIKWHPYWNIRRVLSEMFDRMTPSWAFSEHFEIF